MTEKEIAQRCLLMLQIIAILMVGLVFAVDTDFGSWSVVAVGVYIGVRMLLKWLNTPFSK